jgi:hypothetical protein
MAQAIDEQESTGRAGMSDDYLEHQGVGAADLTTTTTIDFSGQPELWAAFREEFENNDPRWRFNNGTATLIW